MPVIKQVEKPDKLTILCYLSVYVCALLIVVNVEFLNARKIIIAGYFKLTKLYSSCSTLRQLHLEGTIGRTVGRNVMKGTFSSATVHLLAKFMNQSLLAGRLSLQASVVGRQRGLMTSWNTSPRTPWGCTLGQ